MTNEEPGASYPGNSRKSKKEQADGDTPKVPKVVSSEVTIRKAPLGRRIMESFNGEDRSSVGQYLLFDIIVPEFKRIISDVVSTGVERLLFGENARSGRASSGRHHTRYDRFHESSRGRREEPRQLSRQARATHDFRDIVIGDRGEAERVKDELLEYLDIYHVASVSVFYDLVGISGTFQDDRWGWYDLRGIRVVPARGGGYMLELPRPEEIER